MADMADYDQTVGNLLDLYVHHKCRYEVCYMNSTEATLMLE
jgi:hypothetical protein